MAKFTSKTKGIGIQGSETGSNSIDIETTMEEGEVGYRTRNVTVRLASGAFASKTDRELYEPGRPVSGRFEFDEPIESLIICMPARW